jgi:hypothetical protein
LPADVRRRICDMASATRTWGEERIASELLLKLSICVSPPTAWRYMLKYPGPVLDKAFMRRDDGFFGHGVRVATGGELRF